jgi:hypothetical protein
MASITIQHAAHPVSFNTYLHNVGQAGRAFLAALIAFEFAPATAAKVSAKAEISAQDKAPGQTSMLNLYRLASQTDSISPDLLDEIRLLAARESMRRRRLV